VFDCGLLQRVTRLAHSMPGAFHHVLFLQPPEDKQMKRALRAWGAAGPWVAAAEAGRVALANLDRQCLGLAGPLSSGALEEGCRPLPALAAALRPVPAAQALAAHHPLASEARVALAVVLVVAAAVAAQISPGRRGWVAAPADSANSTSAARRESHCVPGTVWTDGGWQNGAAKALGRLSMEDGAFNGPGRMELVRLAAGRCAAS